MPLAVRRAAVLAATFAAGLSLGRYGLAQTAAMSIWAACAILTARGLWAARSTWLVDPGEFDEIDRRHQVDETLRRSAR